MPPESVNVFIIKFDLFFVSINRLAQIYIRLIRKEIKMIYSPKFINDMARSDISHFWRLWLESP